MDNLTRVLNKELEESIEKYLWMSFCDTDKPSGEQFLGVIITKTLGIGHAMQKTHELGINPGGQIASWEWEDAFKVINPEDFDRLLSKEELEEAGYI